MRREELESALCENGWLIVDTYKKLYTIQQQALVVLQMRKLTEAIWPRRVLILYISSKIDHFMTVRDMVVEYGIISGVKIAKGGMVIDYKVLDYRHSSTEYFQFCLQCRTLMQCKEMPV